MQISCLYIRDALAASKSPRIRFELLMGLFAQFVQPVVERIVQRVTRSRVNGVLIGASQHRSAGATVSSQCDLARSAVYPEYPLVGRLIAAHADYPTSKCGANLSLAGLDPAVGLHPTLMDAKPHLFHKSSTCHHLSGFYAGTDLYCSVTD